MCFLFSSLCSPARGYFHCASPPVIPISMTLPKFLDLWSINCPPLFHPPRSFHLRRFLRQDPQLLSLPHSPAHTPFVPLMFLLSSSLVIHFSTCNRSHSTDSYFGADKWTHVSLCKLCPGCSLEFIWRHITDRPLNLRGSGNDRKGKMLVKLICICTKMMCCGALGFCIHSLSLLLPSLRLLRRKFLYSLERINQMCNKSGFIGLVS